MNVVRDLILSHKEISNAKMDKYRIEKCSHIEINMRVNSKKVPR